MTARHAQKAEPAVTSYRVTAGVSISSRARSRRRSRVGKVTSGNRQWWSENWAIPAVTATGNGRNA